MDLQLLANFSALIEQYQKAKAAGNDKLLKLDEQTCSLNVRTYNEQTSEIEWKFLGNLPTAGVDLVVAAKQEEIDRINALKVDMVAVLKG